MQLGQDLARLAASIVSDPESSDEHAAEAPPFPHPKLLPRSSGRERTSSEGEMKLSKLLLPGARRVIRPAHHVRPSSSACLKPRMARAGSRRWTCSSGSCAARLRRIPTPRAALPARCVTWGGHILFTSSDVPKGSRCPIVKSSSPPCVTCIRSKLGSRVEFANTVPTLEASQRQILSQSPTDATRFWWHLYGS